MPRLRMIQRDQCHLCNQIRMRSRNKQQASTTISKVPGELAHKEPGELVHYDMHFPQDIIISHFVDDATGYKWMFNHKKRDAETIRRIFNALKAKLESIRNHKTNEFLRLRKIRTDTGSEIW